MSQNDTLKTLDFATNSTQLHITKKKRKEKSRLYSYTNWSVGFKEVEGEVAGKHRSVLSIGVFDFPIEDGRFGLTN